MALPHGGVLPIDTSALARAAVRWHQRRDARDALESPPESTVYQALREHFIEPIKYQLDPSSPWAVVAAFRGRHGVLIPQFKIGRYRADFGVVGERVRLVVEVDGWTFHSSRESFENDRRRDRELMMRGWMVARFTASEANYEPAKCAEQVIDILEGNE
jgi:very-short-patch-repair endonuclease